MKLGLVYPQTELKGSPEAARQMFTWVEQEGFDHIVTYDHPMGAMPEDRDPPLTGGYNMNHPFHDPFTLLTFAAGLTTRAELMTGVLILPERQTVIVAKQATDLALFSGDRFRLGIGTGWNWVEYTALGREFATRGRYMDEQIGLLRRLWTEHCFSYQGSLESFERAGIVIRPRQLIPIWMGGFSEPAFRRAGRVGDGFHFAGGGRFDPSHWPRVQHHLRENDRSELAFARNLIVGAGPAGPREVAEELLRWRDAGHTHGTVDSSWRGFTSVEQHLDYYAAVAAVVRSA